ncbi:hypothetical protein ACVWZZ_004415 [Bradyrhizobium sp. LM6.10]
MSRFERVWRPVNAKTGANLGNLNENAIAPPFSICAQKGDPMLSFKTHALSLSVAPKHQDHTAQQAPSNRFVRKEAEEPFARQIKVARVASRQSKEN